LEDELQSFHDFLLHFPVDTDAAHTPLDTGDRNLLISISETSLDSTARAITDGTLSFFIDQLPTSDKYQGNAMIQNKIEDFRATLKDIIERTNPATGKVNISRDELHSLFKYCNDKVPESPNKFTTMLKHHRVYTIKVRVGERAVYGVTTTWADLAHFPTYVKDHFTPKKVKTK
jgi:hypothetical protein